jgi:glycosyltransferase involved in cell wall biosynthesis
MKLGLFISQFNQTEISKDPGLIARALADAGYEVTVYCRESRNGEEKAKAKAAPAALPFTIRLISRAEFNSGDFWRAENNETVIIYSWLSLRYSRLIRLLKANGSKVILKLDSDGRLIYPAIPTYLRARAWKRTLISFFVYLIRLAQWYIFPRTVSWRRIKQIELSDALIIESPRAAYNLQESLAFWKKEGLSSKIWTIANPVLDLDNLGNNFHPSRQDERKKSATIISVGRWTDRRKNGRGLAEALMLLTGHSTWNIILIGQGSVRLKDKIHKKNPNLEISALENVPHQEICRYLNRAKIFLASSLSDSFNLAAAEALCCGCSLAGTPIESFYFFTADNQYGSIAADFSGPRLAEALEKEIKKWENDIYSSEDTAKYWQHKLSTAAIGEEIDRLIRSL